MWTSLPATAYDDMMPGQVERRTTRGQQESIRFGSEHVLRRPWPWLAMPLLLVAVAPASATCVSQWDCTKGSPCERVQTCSNVFQTPAIPPSGVLTSPHVS